MRATVFNAAQLFVAAFVALLIAISLDLYHPFWAAMPVWVVSQAYREDLLIRGVLRVVGTIAGAALALAVLHYSPSPYVLVPALALIMGLSTAAAFWIGTIYSYGAVMIGITSVIIIVPSLIGGAGTIELAIDRFWCTLIGVICVTVVTFYFTPRRTEPHPERITEGRLKLASMRGVVSFAVSFAGMAVLTAYPHFAVMSAVLSLGIYSVILGAAADPTPIIRFMGPGSTLGILTSIVYRMILDWGIPSEALHLTLIGVFVAAGAFLRANPRTAPFGLNCNLCFLLSGEVGGEVHTLQHVIIGGAILAIAAYSVSKLYHFMPRYQTS
ncbi:FUSC family protein [uncultured Roseibium sp.]|uniref:FUSC family protein n=1 Tax=uncultured Roseibium sp. TaxID=1936171 RepID=UPI003217AF68